VKFSDNYEYDDDSDEYYAELDGHELSFRGQCMMVDGVISGGAAIFHRGNGDVWSFSMMINGRPAQGAIQKIYFDEIWNMKLKSRYNFTHVGGCLYGVWTVDSAIKNNGLGKEFDDEYIYQGEYQDYQKTNGKVYRL
jgi:hypothetical protein